MNKKSFLHKILVAVNIVIALLLLIAYASTFINPKYLKFISIVGLATPFLLIANFIFVVYWAVKLQKIFLVSIIALLVNYQQIGLFYNLSSKKVIATSDTKIMSFNVRLFNRQKWIDDDKIPQKINTFFKNVNPDILCLQEYKASHKITFPQKYNYVKLNSKKQTGLAVYSKYKIINKGSLHFPNTSNNAIFVDIVKNKDTIRLYNIHLQSLKINLKEEVLDTEHTKNMIKRLETAFNKQAKQVELIKKHQSQCEYKTIVCGDFNNTAFSWVYSELKKEKNDAFEIAGNGFGKTYNYKFPFRIDFILADKELEINYFETYSKPYSDHNPIMARIQF